MKKKIEPPKLLGDLISDMRDRRLLLPALLLVVALVAVPVGLSTSPSAPPAPAAAAAGASGGISAAEPAVLTEQVGIRSYRKRLAQLKQKNPFQRHFALPKLQKTNPGVLAPPTASSSSPAPAPAPTAPAPAGTDTSTASTTEPVTTTTTHTVTVQQPRKPRQVRLYSWVADVKVGPQGSLERHDGVKNLEYLPEAHTPMLIFAGAKLNGEQASFLVSDDVSSVDGGVCRPGRAKCQVLRMKPGDEASLDYAPDGKTYILKLIGIRQVRVSKADGGTPVAAR
jgi:hypothetical protein